MGVGKEPKIKILKFLKNAGPTTMEDFPLLGIYKFDLSGMRFQTLFGGGNLNVNDFHHQIRFEIWNETV
jgi:hypothetical protein